MQESSNISVQSVSTTDEYLTAPCVPMDTNPAKFWKENQKKYSSLALLAKETLGVPPSSSAVERVFSIAGKGFTPERCRFL